MSWKQASGEIWLLELQPVKAAEQASDKIRQEICYSLNGWSQLFIALTGPVNFKWYMGTAILRISHHTN